MKKIIRVLIVTLYSFGVFFAGVLYAANKAIQQMTYKEERAERADKLFCLLDDWMRKKQEGKSIACFLEKMGYHSVAIYGMSNLGERLAKELEGSSIKVEYGIDRRDLSLDLPMYKIEDELPDVDAVIVTATVVFEKIEEALKEKMTCPVYSIEDVVYFME